MKSFNKKFFNFRLNSCNVLLNLAWDPAYSKSLQSCNKRISVQLQTLGKESGVSVNFLWCASKRLSV